MAKYQGHKNWNHWNVSFWINNDDFLFRNIYYFIREQGTKDKAAKAAYSWLAGTDRTHTPDGAPYSVSSIRAAMVGM